MITKQPWLRAGGTASVPFGAALRRTDVDTNVGPWTHRGGVRGGLSTPTTPASDEAGPAPCAGCTELASLREDLDGSHTEAIELGRREGFAQTDTLRDKLLAAIAAAEQARDERDEAMIEQVVDLTLGLCAELAPAAAAIDRRGLVQLVARSLEAGGGSRDLQLSVCAEDAAVLGTQLPAGMQCTVRADLVPGEVWVEAPRLVVDGRWVTRLAALREPLLALVRAAEPAFELASPRGES